MSEVSKELLQTRQSGERVSQSLKHVFHKKIHFIVYAGAEDTKNVSFSERYG